MPSKIGFYLDDDPQFLVLTQTFTNNQILSRMHLFRFYIEECANYTFKVVRHSTLA